MRLRKSTLRHIACLLGWCPFKTNSDEGGCWGECVLCQKRAGFVSRAVLRAYIDREIRERAK